MLYAAICLFLIAVVCGLVLLAAILQNRPAPKLALYLHGPAALCALVLTFIYAFTVSSNPLLLTSLVLLSMAALGGLTLFLIDKRKHTLRKLIAVIHPLVALAGLLTLIVSVLP